jgi:hypothetical protein
MSLSGVGSVQLQRNEASEAFKSFNEAIHYVRREGLPEMHPIVQMLWNRSHAAACMMSTVSNTEDKKRVSSAIFENHEAAQTNACVDNISRLEEKVKAEKEKGDTEECIKTMHLVVELRRKCVAGSHGSEQSRNNAKQQLAASLLLLGRLEILTNGVKRGMMRFKEALDLCKKSGLNHGDSLVQEIEKSLLGIRRQLRHRLSPSPVHTKAEF